MRGDIFQAISDPTSRAIIVFIALHAMALNSITELFQHYRQSVLTPSHTLKMRPGKT